MATWRSRKERDHRRHGCLDYSVHTGASLLLISRTDLNSIERFILTKIKKKKRLRGIFRSQFFVTKLCNASFCERAIHPLVTFEKNEISTYPR